MNQQNSIKIQPCGIIKANENDLSFVVYCSVFLVSIYLVEITNHDFNYRWSFYKIRLYCY
jgi:hypothetical protein